MSTKHVNWLGERVTFEYAESVAGYWVVALRLITGYWILHAGWTKFAFVAGEPFSAAGYLVNAPAASPLSSFSRGPRARRGYWSSPTS